MNWTWIYKPVTPCVKTFTTLSFDFVNFETSIEFRDSLTDVSVYFKTPSDRSFVKSVLFQSINWLVTSFWINGLLNRPTTFLSKSTFCYTLMNLLKSVIFSPSIPIIWNHNLYYFLFKFLHVYIMFLYILYISVGTYLYTLYKIIIYLLFKLKEKIIIISRYFFFIVEKNKGGRFFFSVQFSK